MKLLLDANLSWRMVPVLRNIFADCVHIDQVAELVNPARDDEIWNFAKANDLIIVTNDEDFIDLINLKGFPPKVILLKVGDRSREFVSNILTNRRNDIKLLWESEETGLLEIVSSG